MKKVILSILLTFLISAQLQSQVRTRFFMSNPTIEVGNLWTIELRFTVPTGQTWKVGSCNIRVNWSGSPNAANLSVHPDASVSGANPLLHNNSNYGLMTTTSILGGATISLNVVHNPSSPCATFGPGTYSIGRLRWNRLDTAGGQCVTLTQRTTGTGPSVVYDSLTQLLYATGWDTLATSPAGCIRIDYLTGVAGNQEIPTVFKLYTSYPNPFNPSTTIKYDIPRSSFVQMTIYDILGREVSRLINQNLSPGRYEIVWDGTNYASGTYFYKLEAGTFTDIKKMILVK
jgi:hypothetical protein